MALFGLRANAPTCNLQKVLTFVILIIKTTNRVNIIGNTLNICHQPVVKWLNETQENASFLCLCYSYWSIRRKRNFDGGIVPLY